MLAGADVTASLQASDDDVASGGTRRLISDPGSPPPLLELRFRRRTTKVAVKNKRMRPRTGRAIMGISLEERGALWEGEATEDRFAGKVGIEGVGGGGGGEGYNGKNGDLVEVEEDDEGYFGKGEGRGGEAEGG